jgi:transposase-like protein
MKNTEIHCPYCNNNEHIKKNGHRRGQQIYMCGKCKKTFNTSNVDKRIKHPILLRKLTLTFYLSGTSMRGIQKALSICFNKKIAFTVVNNWIKNSNNILVKKKREKENKKEHEMDTKKTIQILEMDELFTYVKKN